jgi:nitrate reductase assembly molybdenum cofactor insertion protein NarJ
MNVESLTVDPQTQRLLAEAAEWRLIALLFERPRDGWQAEVASLAAEVQDPTLKEAAAASAEATEGLYHTTLGPGGPASPREVTYRKTAVSGHFLAELCAFYAAFAYQPVLDEPPDHVAVQAGFVGYLRLKEAFARACGSEDQATIAADAASRFVGEHLAVMAQRLAASLERSGISYLTLAGAALLSRTGAGRSEAAAEWSAAEPIPDEIDACGLDGACALAERDGSLVEYFRTPHVPSG